MTQRYCSEPDRLKMETENLKALYGIIARVRGIQDQVRHCRTLEVLGQALSSLRLAEAALENYVTYFEGEEFLKSIKPTLALMMPPTVAQPFSIDEEPEACR